MTIRHMRIFLEVCRTMNVTRAAENLYMTQPAVSRSIREMEKHYGVRLFERLNQRLYVTESGRRMHAYAVHIVDTFDRMEREMTDGDERGILRIGASITLGNYDLPALIQKMRQEKPQLRIQATVANAGTLEDMLLDNRLDIALIEGSVASDELVTEPFAQDKLLLILPPDHELTRKDAIFLSDLMRYDLLLREKGSSGRAFLNTVFESQGLTLSPLWESASTQALLSAVREGLGITLVPWALARQTVLRGEAERCPVTDAELIRRRYVAWHPSKYVTGTMRAFVNLCMEQAKSA